MSPPETSPSTTSPKIYTVTEFCEEIRESVAQGKGIIPLVGAGLSATAGIPVGDELMLYLKLCVAMSLGLDGDENKPNGHRWHPRLNAWPEMRGDWVQRAVRGKRRLDDVVTFRFEKRREGRTYAFQQICRQAAGALTDWRLALQFLARIKLPEDTRPRKEDASPFALNRDVDSLMRIARNIGQAVKNLPDLIRDLTKIEEKLVPFLRQLPYEQYQVMGPEWDLNRFIGQVHQLCDSVLDVHGSRAASDSDSSSSLTKFVDEVGKLQEELAAILTKRVCAREPIVLGEVDTHVTDSFFNHLIRGAAPAMGHRMIVHFGRTLRTDIVLSLNFDDLLEQAFRNAGVEPAVFEVHHNASLPPASLLGPQKTLIKLHGGRYGLRADFTLDRDPTDHDRAHFRSYFLGEDWPIERDRSAQGDNKSNSSPPIPRYDLLVAGFSGNDRHIRRLIQDALAQLNVRNDRTRTPFRVFWCCFSPEDVALVKRYFKKELAAKRVIPVRADNLGLLFWEIYQNATRCLPPGGLEYPSAWRLPASPQLLPEELKKFEASPWVETAGDATDWLQSRRRENEQAGAKSTSSTASIFLIESPQELQAKISPGSGFTTFGWRLFQNWHGSNRCIWIDSEDLTDAKELKTRLLHAVACHVGRGFQRPSISESSPDGVFVEELLDLLMVSGKPWVLFLNLRGAHGYYADPFQQLRGPKSPIPIEFKKDLGNAAAFCKDRRALWQWNKKKKADLRNLLKMLVGEGGSAVPPSSRSALRRLLSIVILSRANDRSAIPKDKLLVRPKAFASASGKKSPKTLANPAIAVANSAKQWALLKKLDPKDKQGPFEHKNAEKVARARVLLALLLYQPVCHSTALVSRAVLDVPSDDTSCEGAWVTVNRYVEELERRTVIRRRAGGFLWIHWEVRERLLAILLTDPVFRALRPAAYTPVGKRSYLQSLYPQLHLGIGDWMMTFFRATGDQTAAIRAIYHRCWIATLSFIDYGDPNRLVRGRGALCEASNHIELARASILTSGHGLDVTQCLEGYIERVLCQLLEEELKAVRGGPGPYNIRNLRFLVMVKMKAQLFRIWFHRDLGNCDRVYQALGQYQDEWRHEWDRPWADGQSTLWKIYEAEWPDEAYWNDGYLKLERAVLGITTRAYGYAKEKLWKIAGEVGFIAKIIVDPQDFKIWEEVNTWVRGPAPHLPPSVPERMLDINRFQARRLLYHCLRRLMEVELLRAELEDALDPLQTNLSDRHDALNHVQRLYLAAQLLPRYVMESESGPLRVEQSRVHSIMAGALAMRGDDQGVERQLNESLAALDHLTASDDAISATVVALRRIYCKLHQIRAVYEPIDQSQRIAGSETSRKKRLLPRYLHEGWQSPITDENANSKMRKEIVAAEALLVDIDQILFQARVQLNRQRKSLWWWMTMCRFQMAWFELRTGIRHWRHHHDKNAPADIHAQAEDLDQAIELLRDVSRRVKFDFFQLARIADSFLNLVAYLENVGAPALRDRHESVRIAYKVALEGINNVRSSIEDLKAKSKDTPNNRANIQVWTMDPRAHKFVQGVMERLVSKVGASS